MGKVPVYEAVCAAVSVKLQVKLELKSAWRSANFKLLCEGVGFPAIRSTPPRPVVPPAPPHLTVKFAEAVGGVDRTRLPSPST